MPLPHGQQRPWWLEPLLLPRTGTSRKLRQELKSGPKQSNMGWGPSRQRQLLHQTLTLLGLFPQKKSSQDATLAQYCIPAPTLHVFPRRAKDKWYKLRRNTDFPSKCILTVIRFLVIFCKQKVESEQSSSNNVCATTGRCFLTLQ